MSKVYAEKDCVISRSDYGVPSHVNPRRAYADLEEEIRFTKRPFLNVRTRDE